MYPAARVGYIHFFFEMSQVCGTRLFIDDSNPVARWRSKAVPSRSAWTNDEDESSLSKYESVCGIRCSQSRFWGGVVTSENGTS